MDLAVTSVGVLASAGDETLFTEEIFELAWNVPARDYFGTNQIQMVDGQVFAPTLDQKHHFDVAATGNSWVNLSSGVLTDVTSSYDSSTSRLTLTFANAGQMADYSVTGEMWVGRFEPTSGEASVTLTKTKFYSILSIDTANLTMVLNVSSSDAIFNPPADTSAGATTVLTTSSNLATLYYILSGL